MSSIQLQQHQEDTSGVNSPTISSSNSSPSFASSSTSYRRLSLNNINSRNNNNNNNNNNITESDNNSNNSNNSSSGSSNNINNRRNVNNLNNNDMSTIIRRFLLERSVNSVLIFLLLLLIFALVNVTFTHSVLWMVILIASLVTTFQICHIIQNRMGGMYTHTFYSGQHWNVNRLHNSAHGRLHHPSLSRFSHLLNAPLNLQLTLIDRDFNSNDYEMLLALDSDNQNYSGAKTEQIELLPLHCLATQKDLDDLFQDPDEQPSEECRRDCSICLDTFQVGDSLRTLPCMHHYHSDCIDKWLNIKSSCPVCKSEVVFN